MDRDAARARLAPILHSLAAEQSARLETLKSERSEFERPDFVWHYLLQSFATMGRARGWAGLIGDAARYGRVRFDRLAALSAQEREAEVRAVCREAGIRMPNRKATFILGCFERIEAMGGPAEARRLLVAEAGRAGKLAFLDAFPGIGPKYARNIMMDVYHEEFRDTIAIDVRISKITRCLGLAFATYEDEEGFYLSVAEAAGLEGWDVDRLLFNFASVVAARLAA